MVEAVTVRPARNASAKWLDFKILTPSSLKRRFYEVHFCETRAGQGFQPDQRTKIYPKSGGSSEPPQFRRPRPKFILLKNSTPE
jgi:hypothetical protein